LYKILIVKIGCFCLIIAIIKIPSIGQFEYIKLFLIKSAKSEIYNIQLDWRDNKNKIYNILSQNELHIHNNYWLSIIDQ